MSNLKEVYGSNYQQQVQESKVDHLINIIGNNFAHREFIFHLDGCNILWDSNNHLLPEACQKLIKRVCEINPKLEVNRIDLNNSYHRKLIPYFIKDTPVEYFYLIDREYNRCYLPFITPVQTGIF